jgi:hypothetical protein
MRSWCAFVRGAWLAASISILSCASSRAPIETTESHLALEGEVTVDGSLFRKTASLADAGGTVCILRNPRLELELLNLAGHRVRVVGRVTGKTPAGPEFWVDRYEMLPIDGLTPIVGVLELHEGVPMLTAEPSGATYVLGGPLRDALKSFAGAKVWVSGRVHGDGERFGSGTPTFTVEGYGILLPAPEATDAAP